MPDPWGVPLVRDDHRNVKLIYLYFHVAGALLDECWNLTAVLLNGRELEKEWVNVFNVVAEAVEEDLRLAQDVAKHAASLQIDGAVSELGTSAMNAAASSNARVVSQLLKAVFDTLGTFVSFRRYKKYLGARGLDLFGRVFCAISLLLAETYNEEDYNAATVHWWHKEAILSCEMTTLAPDMSHPASALSSTHKLMQTACAHADF